MSAETPLLLLVSLAAGYTLAQRSHLLKHRWAALEWEQNLFEASLWGIYLFVLARATLPILEHVGGCAALRSRLHEIVPFPLVPSLLLAVILSDPVSRLLNLVVGQKWAVLYTVEKHGGELLRLLQKAGTSTRLVMLTMQTRKVYVGYVLAQPGPKDPYITLLPSISGFRDEDTLTVEFTTYYDQVHLELLKDETEEAAAMRLEDFGIVLPVSHVCSATIFDAEAYAHFEANKMSQASPNRKKDALSKDDLPD